jgi:hypothetical protein
LVEEAVAALALLDKIVLPVLLEAQVAQDLRHLSQDHLLLTVEAVEVGYLIHRDRVLVVQVVRVAVAQREMI